jgi:glycosyltransferase involved in cell wall biosynthesis
VVGTIDRHKEQHVAVAALKHLHRDGVPSVLELVGPEADTAYAQEVRALAARQGLADEVFFTGATNGIQDVLGRTDVLMLPAGELTPLVLMQALAAETPVVAAKMGSVEDIVQDRVTGLLVKPGDPAAFAIAVKELAASPRTARALAKQGRRHVVRNFDQAKLVEMLRAEIVNEIHDSRRQAHHPGRRAAADRA